MRTATILAGTTMGVLLAGCGPATSPDPDPALPAAVAASSVGDRTSVTGVVDAMLSDYIFVLGSAEDPRQHLLVVNTVRADVPPGDTATVTGQVLRFHYAEFSGPYWLTDTAPFQRYENHKFLLATELRSGGHPHAVVTESSCDRGSGVICRRHDEDVAATVAAPFPRYAAATHGGSEPVAGMLVGDARGRPHDHLGSATCEPCSGPASASW